MKEISLGVLASLFFAVTFILNRSMELSGGSWLWSASLRYLFMVPFLVAIVLFRGNAKSLLIHMKAHWKGWLLWSTVGFGLFYAPITFAAAYGPGWLVAGSWQLTIVAGVLLGPLFYHRIETIQGPQWIRHQIPRKALLISTLILVGVICIQSENAKQLSSSSLLASFLPVLIAAFCYPLGNRKMMELCGGTIDTFQRVLGMTLASLPFWLLLATIGMIQSGPPSATQVSQSFIVALSSGVIATTLFFIATDRVRQHQGKLAAVEATQSVQVLFVVIGEILLLSASWPSGIASVGLIIIMVGMLLHSLSSVNFKKKHRKSA